MELLERLAPQETDRQKICEELNLPADEIKIYHAGCQLAPRGKKPADVFARRSKIV